MNFAYDAEHQFYCMSEEQPRAGYLREQTASASMIAVDTETISLKERIAICMAIAVSSSCCFCFVLFPTESDAVPWYLLKSSKVLKIYHNILFDANVLREYDLDNTNIADTSVMSRLLGNKFNDLTSLGQYHLMPTQDAGEFLKQYNTKLMTDVPMDEVARKCCQDALATFRLYEVFVGKVDAEYLDVEMQTIPIMLRMSWRGILIDQQERARIEVLLQEQVDVIRENCAELGFNPGSSEQVAYILAKQGAYGVFTRLPFTRGKGKHRLSSGKEVLARMDDPLARVIEQYREYDGLLSRYIKPWANDDRATTRYHLDAATGRPSSTDRNMQNIPGKFKKDGSEYPCNCRGVLLPDNEIWTDSDFSQVEPRCLAYLANDREMQYIFSQPQHLPDNTRNPEADYHGQTATALGVTRKEGKVFNLAMTYGATDETLMETIGTRDISKVRRQKAAWAQKYPQAYDWIESIQEFGLSHGYVTTVYGRKLRLPTLDEDSEDGIRRKAVDYPCQGSAAEILKRAIIKLQHLDIALQVHDELLIDGMIDEKELKVMEHIAPFETPIEVKYLRRWE